MNWRDKRITDVIKSHDPMLFVQTNHFGTKQILRKNYRFIKYDLDDGSTLLNQVPDHQYIMALTEDWTPKTPNVDWGLLPILKRLREIDGWNSESVKDNDLVKMQEQIDKQKDKALDNKIESFAYEWRDSFKKGFSDINTSNMNKIDKRKLKGV